MPACEIHRLVICDIKMGQPFYKNRTITNYLIRFAKHWFASWVLRAIIPIGCIVSIFLLTCIAGVVSAMPPSADPLPDLGPFSCYADIPAPNISDVTGETTDCGGPVTVTFIGDSPDPGCSGTVIRTYQLEDTCGITTDIQQNILISDIIAPTADPLPVLGPFSCYGNIPAPNVNAVTGESDNCGGVVTVSHAGDTPNPGCSGTVTRSYLLTDECGNTSMITQSITIDDVIPPVIIACPPDITASCPADVPVPDPGSVTWSDNCGIATVTHVSDESLVDFMSNGIYCTSYLSRLYRVTDLCGNFVQCEQIIQIQDVCDPQYDCPTCEDIVPHFEVDFTENPDSSWTSPAVVREGTCCAQIGPPPPRCIHFTLTLPPSVVAISFNIESGAVPSGSLFYQIDCNEVHQVGDTICLLGDATYELTFCKPGNNENTYSITAFSGDITPDTIHAQVNCGAEIVVEGIVESTAVWSDITGGGLYESYLSCLSGCLTTTFTPDDNAPPFILYEVCGDRGSLICGLSVIVCDTIMAIVHPEIIASVNPNPAIYCADDIGTLTGSVTPPGTYSMQWYSGPNGTGSVVGSGPNYTPTTSGTYSFVVSDLINDYNCGEDTANVQVTIVPLPQFELGQDTSVCTEASVFFDLPNGVTYTWLPSTGVVQGGDASQFIVTAPGTTTYTVTAVTAEGCEWTDTWSISVVTCTVDCPEQTHCTSSDIIIYQTVGDFINAGGSISLPCTIQAGSISLVATNSDGQSCPESITHTYEIEDDCGNTETCDVVIILNDTIPPVWTNSPAAIGPLSCTDPIPPHENLTASDNCAYIINTSIDPYEPDYCNGYSFTMRWTLTDSCGNNAPDQTLEVNVLPQEPPVFIDPPVSDTTIYCDDVADIVIPDLAYDNGQIGNCLISGTVPGVMNGPVNECGGQFTIEWNYTDTCGRSIIHILTVTVTDDVDPVITCPADLDFECNADVPPVLTTYADFTAAGGTAMDNCGLLIASFAVSETDNGTCPRVITRTYSIADSCGNTAQCIQTITVDDPESPVVTCPGDLMFECYGDVPPAYTTYNAFINGGGSASDNCGLVESSFTLIESEMGTCPQTITRTYSIADSCGNTGQCIQTIIVDDQESPVMSCPGDLMFACSGDVPAAFNTYTDFINGGGSASDNCGLVETSFAVTEADNGTCPRTITRTYSIADSCGNTGQCVQIITVDDTENPVITCPGNQMFECSGDIPPVFTSYTDFINGGGTASDNCELVEASFSVTETNSGNCPRTITRTYSIADLCGNTGQCVQTIIIDDTTPPLITCPGNVNDECSSNIPPAFTTLTGFLGGGGSVSDNCALDISSFSMSETDNGNCPRTITRIYSIADSCGNTSQCVQTINIDDTTPPVITCPGDVNEECSAGIPPVFATLAGFIAGGGSASDNCALDASSFTVTQSDNGTCPRTIIRTYQIADSCGNTGQCVQTIIIDDTTPPVITCPAGVNEECSGDITPAFTTLAEFIAGGGAATDNCALDEPSFTMTETDIGTCPRTITRIYEIADSCGNTGQCVQTITVADTEPPFITCPPDLNFECVGDVPPSITTYAEFISGGGNISDNCAIDESTFSVTESSSGMCPRIIIRTYSIEDSCGNVGQCVQTITIDDPEPPVMTCPGDLNFECIGDVPPAPATYNDFINNGGSATDNCGIDASTYAVTESVSGICPMIITRTYSIADSCGNTGQCVQTITIDDPEPPLMTCPADLNFECIGDAPQVLSNYTGFINGGGSATDNCGINESTFAVSESVSGSCPKIIVRTYSIEDSCGNVAQCVQTITVDDSTPPVITCPANVNDECSSDIPPAFTTLADFLGGGGSASDNCALDPTSFSMSETDNGNCPRTITRTYSIADSCGNSSQCVQTINIDDTTPPLITCPGDVNEECSTDIPPAFTTMAGFIAGGGSVSDNCALDENSFSVTETDNGTCPRTITRTYSIVDSCGNSSLCVQTIIIDDTTPPVITCPADINEECSGDIPPAFNTLAEFIAGGGTATDNCALDENSFSVTETDNGTCPRTITRIYAIADSCGNTGQCVQTITVADPEPPLVACPPDLNFECIGDVQPPITTYTEFINGGGNISDNCAIDESTFSATESSSGLCPRIITRTYSIEDSCGNLGQCVQTITIDDPEPPVMTCPGDLNFECIGDVPPAPATYNDFINTGGSVTDNCGIDESTFSVTESSSGICPRIITRTYLIADSCGNTGLCVQTITIDDPEPPAMTCPADQNFECIGDVPQILATYSEFINGGGSAIDNCGIDESTFTASESVSGTCPKIITRTYAIADSCGNVAQCVQTITVDDSTPPVITCPANVLEECSDNIPPAFTTLNDFLGGGGSASDNCALDPSSFSMIETDNGSCPRTITRTYSIADSCGNISECIQTINIDDTTPPVITCPGDVNEECGATIPPVFSTLAGFIAGGGNASDNCALDASSFTVTESDNGICPRTIIRTYQIADSCGNTGQCVQTIIIDDTTPPVITCPADVNEECSGSISPAFSTLDDFIAGGGSASDNCSLDASSFTVTESDNGTCPRTIIRTYQIADSCGNTDQCVQTITVEDPQPPLVTCPPDLNFECIGDVPPLPGTFMEFINNGGNATDNCAINESTFSATESASGICPKIITRTYSMEDSCGNLGQCVQTITIDDPEPPAMTCAADLNFECIGDVPPVPATFDDFINSGGSATDNCGIDPSTYSVSESSSGNCPQIIIRTFSVADSCGNLGQCVQTITIDDPEPPVMTCPADLNFECIGDVPQVLANYTEFINGGGSVTDNCGINEPTFTASESVSGTCPKIIVRTYSIEDSCGNQAQCVQTIIVDDSTPPVMTCPANINDECTGIIPPAFTTLTDFLEGGGSVSDNCALDTSSFSMSETDNGTCPRTITRTYSIADSCGNQAQCVQTIIVDDQIPPLLTCPGDLMFECTGEIPVLLLTYTDFINGGGSASDNCELDISSFTATETDSGTCPRTITRTYSIADSCGNMGQCVQTIMVDDQIDPVITCPGDLVLECTGEIPALLATYADFIGGGGNASDNCSLDESSFTATETDNGTCPRTITRTYSIADSCGNVAQCVQTITADDQIDPVITCPGDLMFECTGDIPPLANTFTEFINAGGSASDNCGLDEASFTVTESDNGTCPRMITRTYSIADSCGHIAQCVQTITVDDQMDPVIACPADQMLECSGDVPPAFTTYADFIAGGGSASDNCDLDESTFSVTESDNGICPRTIIRTYSITDSCGNVGECVQTITVDDDINPTASDPAPVTIECSGEVPPPDPSLVNDAADNCSAPVVAFVSDESDGGICPEIITRTYSVTDECGNQILVTQIITIGDNEDPTASDPLPIMIECSGEAPPPDPSVISASDNCSVPVVAFVSDESDGGVCPEIITRIYSVTDECGNQILVTQTITIGDDIAPTASDPAAITLECNGEVPYPDPSVVTDAMDNCSMPVVAFVSDESDGGVCPEIITRIYSVTDECDNQILVTQTITIGDEIPPTATDPAPIEVAGCNAPVPAPDISVITDASDNCSTPIVAFVGDAAVLDGCIETTTRTYSVTDACDNSITVNQTITRTVDFTPPVFTSVPENLTVECQAGIPPIPELEYTDNCSPGDTVTGTESGPVGDPPTVTWTWVATDDCGNSTSVSVTITMTETTTVTNLTDDFCTGDIYILPDSSTTTVGGMYGPYVLTGSNGCDSIVNLDLNGIDPVVITITDAFCEGDEYILPDGTTTTTDGSYGPFDFVTQDGCDSTVFVELTLIPAVFTDIIDEFCEGTTYVLPDGSTTTVGGSFGPYEFISQNGCDSIVNLELVELSQIIIDLSDEFCTGDLYTLPDGSTTTSGGVYGPYIYTAANGCDSIVNLTLTEIGPPNVEINDEGPLCITSGIITLTATPPGGIWSGSVNSDQFDPLASGIGTHEIIYTVTTGGCENADTIYITVYELNLSCEALTEESFPGASDGTASVTVSGGVPPYSVMWTGPVSGSEILNMDDTFIITSLTAGEYTIVVEDAEGCTASCEFTIIANVPCELTIEDILPGDATCPGSNNGSISVFASGNMPPFEYSLDGINYQSSNLFDNLAPGTYTVFVQDNADCMQSQSVTINVGEGPELSILEIVNASCGVNNGSIEVSVSGGTSPFLYSIDGAGYGLSSLFPGLLAGDYLVYLIDDAGCTDTIPATVGASDAPVIVDINVVDASCGVADGSITIQASGGLGVLTYSINGGLIFQTSPVFNGLSAGNYFIVVKDEADCQAIGSATIQETGGPVISAIVSTPTGCGFSDGTITITASGAPVLQYSINGIQYQTSGFFSGLAAGNYTVSVRDGNGCIAIGQVTLNTTDGPLIEDIEHTNTRCGLDDGTILITASGGTGELEYLLNGESYGDQNFMEDLPSGVYFIEVVDENGCTATGQVTINSSEGPDFDVYITPAHCGMADGIIELDGKDGTPPYTYSINGGPFTANFTFVNRPSEYYIMAIKDANGCIYEEEVFLWEATGPDITDVIVTDPDCGMNNGIIQITATGTELQYSILTPPAFQSTPEFDSVGPGTYTIIIKDKFNCRVQSSAVVPENPVPAITATPTDSECGLSTGSILVNATGGTPPYMFKLDQGNYGNSNFFGDLPAGVYTVTVQGANGCEATESVTIGADGVQMNSLSVSICEGGVYELHGNVYTVAGNYSITLQGGASNGCDSVIALSLEVTPLEQKILQDILCPGEVFTYNGVDYNTSGQYLVDTLHGSSGCDTILTLDLLVGDFETKYIDADICQGEVYTIDGVDYDLPGDYIIDTIPAVSGCDSIRILRLEINPLPQANAGADHLLDCDMQSVILDGSVTGGEPFWAGPGIHAGNENQLKPQVTLPGVYILTVTSPDNCTHEDVAIVDADPSTVIADAGPDAFLSCDIVSLVLQAGPIGPDLVYQWTGPGINSQNEHMVSPVITVPGIYSLVVTNTSTECVSLPDTVVITDISTEIIAIVQDPNSLDCFSTFIDLNATGSSTGNNLVYVWFNSEGEIIGNTPILEVSSGGMFTFLVKDTISGCFDRDTVSVTDLIAYPPVEAGDPKQIDCYQETVVLNEGAHNNLPHLVFMWTGPPGGIIGPDTLLSIMAGAGGLYFLEAEDTITGCKNIDSVMVTDLSILPEADIRLVESITCIDSMALLDTGLSTSGPEITYTWSGPEINGVTSTFIEPVNPGLYTLTVFNTLTGCASDDTMLLNLPEQLLDLDAMVEVPVCEGDASGSIIITGVTGGMPEYMYSINGQTSQSSPVFENLVAGLYSISVIDGNGCTYSESLTIDEGMTLTIDIGIDIELVLGDSITLGADVNLPWSQVDSLVWTPGEILSCTYCINPVLYGLQDNVIVATVYSGGCVAEDRISLRVDVDVEIFIPNVFTPDGDGMNDHVTVFTDPRVKRVVHLEIFDRWGNNVFIGTDFPPNDPLLGWDGTFRNKPMNPAVFAYVAQVELINGSYAFRKGDITLIR